jgi:exonuclease III
MRILSWNCRGLQQAAAIRALLHVQKCRSPDVMFLMETHLDDYPAECLRRRLKMDHKYVVQSDGKSGGLILFWKKEVPVSLRDKNKNLIDVFIGSGADNFWRFTGLYGEPKWADKHLTWQRLKELKAVCNMPWVVIGDMNEIMFSFEKEGGNPWQHLEMQLMNVGSLTWATMETNTRGTEV